jgi:hypothetical protein
VQIYWNKESQTADKGRFSEAWGLEEKLKTPHRKKKKLITRCHTKPRKQAIVNAVMNLPVP